MLANVMFYGFLVLVVFTLCVDGGLEKTTEIIVKGLLTIVDFIARTREYFTSRSRSNVTKRIESVMYDCIEMKEK